MIYENNFSATVQKRTNDKRNNGNSECAFL